MTFTDSTDPARVNRSCNSASPTSYGRFPTYSFRPMAMNSSVAIATCPTSNDVGGCRLVARLNFRRSESGVARYTGGRHCTRQDPSCEDNTDANGSWYHRALGFSHALCRPVGVTSRFWLAPPHIQLSHATNPFRSCGSDALSAPWRRGRIAYSTDSPAGIGSLVMKDRFSAVLET